MNKGIIVAVLMGIVLLAIIGLLIWNISDKNSEIHALQEENETLLKQDRKKGQLIDSATRVIKKQDDSLKIAKNTIILIDSELKELHSVTNRKIKRYETILFVRYPTDSLRWRAWSELYPSTNHN
jgi:hypothetical protein